MDSIILISMLLPLSLPFLMHRHDITNIYRPRRVPLGSVDSEDGNALADDELHTLLPGTREISTDDLSQVLCHLLHTHTHIVAVILLLLGY